MTRFAPAPGSSALELRQICDQLTRSTATIARHGIRDFSAIDAAGADFLPSIIQWEITDESGKPARWACVLGGSNNVRTGWRQASSCAVVDGDEGKLG